MAEWAGPFVATVDEGLVGPTGLMSDAVIVAAQGGRVSTGPERTRQAVARSSQSERATRQRWERTLKPREGAALGSSDIDQVIDRLGKIVDWSWERESRIGYFAAMYRRVTVAVKEAIEAGEFKDPERMTRLDVVFANRYIEAFEQYREGRRPTASWAVSFQASTRRRLLIVQQLLTGINAHINLDLGIAAATVAPGHELTALRDDFDTINEVLGRLVEGFVDEVEQVSPWIRYLGMIGGRSERIVIKFSIDRARDEAWDVATRLAPEPQPEWPRIIDDRDQLVAKFGRFLQRPGIFLPIGLLIIRLRETNDVRRVIDGLTE